MPGQHLEDIANRRQRRQLGRGHTDTKALVERGHENQLAQRIPGRYVGAAGFFGKAAWILLEQLDEPRERSLDRVASGESSPFGMSLLLLGRIPAVDHQVGAGDPAAAGRQKEHGGARDVRRCAGPKRMFADDHACLLW